MNPEVIVVGSGPTGAIAAETLVRSGVRVLMVDAGQRDDKYNALVPDRAFDELRRTDAAQHRYLLGDAFESLDSETVATGAQLTPPRRFITEKVLENLPLESGSFQPLESLAYGGLGSGWGLGCSTFSREELTRAGLPPDEMPDAYQFVADRIGISGADDDVRRFTYDSIKNVQPALRLGEAAEVLYRRYAQRRRKLNKGGIYVGRPALAVLSLPKDGRRACELNDMEFYSDAGQSAWRPWITVNELRGSANFEYAGNLLITHVSESAEGATVCGFDLSTSERVSFTAARVVLACGTLGTARIVLRSFGGRDTSLPILCNPYTYLPLVVPARMGRSMPARHFSLCQLAMYHEDRSDVAMTYIYGYRSLMLFRLLKKAPVSVQDAAVLLRFLMSGLLIAGIHHPDSATGDKVLRMEPDAASPTKDHLSASFVLNSAEKARVRHRVRVFKKALRMLGALPLYAMDPGNGASIHYAGTLPFHDRDVPMSTSPNGRLNGTRNIFIADGSGFKYLPAKGLTLSLMANAHLVARRIAATIAVRQ